MTMSECPVCGVEAGEHPGPGRPRVYCTGACRQAAYRARQESEDG